MEILSLLLCHFYENMLQTTHKPDCVQYNTSLPTKFRVRNLDTIEFSGFQILRIKNCTCTFNLNNFISFYFSTNLLLVCPFSLRVKRSGDSNTHRNTSNFVLFRRLILASFIIIALSSIADVACPPICIVDSVTTNLSRYSQFTPHLLNRLKENYPKIHIVPSCPSMKYNLDPFRSRIDSSLLTPNTILKFSDQRERDSSYQFNVKLTLIAPSMQMFLLFVMPINKMNVRRPSHQK